MFATIVTVGDELLIGQVVDTNSCFIEKALGDCGVRVIERTSIGDDKSEIRATLDRVLLRSEIVILTGGLGPTKDDITKHTLAEYFGCGMHRDDAVFEQVRTMLAKRGIYFNELNQAQALVPDCCVVLPNVNGTAPGMWFDAKGDKTIISLPGVPFEMEALITNEVVPRLAQRYTLRTNVHKTMITFGIAESVLAAKIEKWEDALPAELHLAYLPSPQAIRLRLSCYDVDRKTGEQMIAHAFGELESIIPNFIIGYEGRSVAEDVAALLVERHSTLAVAESCTGGRIASMFTAMAGASEYFLGGVVSYANSAKSAILGVSADDIEKYGAVSQTVAEQMAVGVRRITGAEYSIATTGIAGPSGGTESKPVGTVWIAVATPDGVTARKMMYGRLRAQNIERASTSAVNMLRLIMTDKFDTPTTESIL